jgi:beta-lactam-binding protein with PASTA domain
MRIHLPKALQRRPRQLKLKMDLSGVKRYTQWTLTGLAMLFTMLLFAAITLRVALHGREVHIPDFAGMTLPEASDAALRGGVDLAIENRFYSTTVPAGRVLSQSPAPDSLVRRGWQVRVTESLGPQQVTIPSVVGQPVHEATVALRRKSLDLGTLAHLDAPGDADMVLAQTPPPNGGVDQPVVSLLLSTTAGGASNAFVLPSFLGMSYGAANRAAAALGVRVGYVSSQDAVAAGTGVVTPVGAVVAQSPQAGSRAGKGDLVKLYFGRMPAQP